MVYVCKLYFLLVVCITQYIVANCWLEPDWSFKILSVQIDNKTPEKAFGYANITRPARDVLALSGIIELKVDITDELLMSVTIDYSPTGVTFFKTPFGIPPTQLSIMLNTFYKEFIMDSILECSDNAPRIEDKFTPPLTKRVIHFNNCLISNDDMPSKLKSGIYRIVTRYINFVDATLTILAEAFQKS